MLRFCEGEVIVQGDEGPVRGVAQVVDCHGVTVVHEERKEEVEERQEVESDEEKTLKERCACPWMGWPWKTIASGLSHVECDVNESSNATTDSVQVCSSLHFAHVHVRRVIHVIVHNGLTVVEGVLVVVHTFTQPFVIVICSWISVSGGIIFTPPVGDSRLLSAVTDIFTINFAFNCCWDSYRKWKVAHRIHRFPRSISGHSIFVANSHNRVWE